VGDMVRNPAMKVFALIAGTTYDLTNLDGYTLLEYSGLGIANVRRLSQRGPFQHGDSDLGFRQDPRLIGLTWGVWGRGDRRLADLESLRVQLYGIFRPRDDDDVQLRFYMPGGRVRAADVNLLGAFEAGTAAYEGYAAQRIAGAFRAADQRLYDPTQQTLTFSLLSTMTGWDIEEIGQTTADGWDIEEIGQTTADGWNIGESVFNQTQTILYAGGSLTADIEYPIIRINGPISSAVVNNQTTGEKIDLSDGGGLELLLGEYVDIDLTAKTLLDNNDVSVDQYLTGDSDLATFHLSYNTEKLADGSRSDGNNVIQVTGAGSTLSTSVTITWYARYIGVD